MLPRITPSYGPPNTSSAPKALLTAPPKGAAPICFSTGRWMFRVWGGAMMGA